MGGLRGDAGAAGGLERGCLAAAPEQSEAAAARLLVLSASRLGQQVLQGQLQALPRECVVKRDLESYGDFVVIVRRVKVQDSSVETGEFQVAGVDA